MLLRIFPLDGRSQILGVVVRHIISGAGRVFKIEEGTHSLKICGTSAGNVILTCDSGPLEHCSPGCTSFGTIVGNAHSENYGYAIFYNAQSYGCPSGNYCDEWGPGE